MSIWDSVKPSKKVVTPTAVVVSKDQKSLSLTWTDGTTTEVSARVLRQYCPCAECVEEWSGKRTFEVETIPQEMKVVEAQPVGNYALSFTFGDLHRTGIFQWEYLRELSLGQRRA
ncbi:MAG: DUF971 domain-containing protein [Archangium gephyra]|uniref:DUF971 domain-containing protein n=1 Tax=Archangium gephyra TaxID=48 RepID=A0A2W5T7L1_9BACT|nr:MAG: DUF971 domain-containing protein [Archangium gephyra]